MPKCDRRYGRDWAESACDYCFHWENKASKSSPRYSTNCCNTIANFQTLMVVCTILLRNRRKSRNESYATEQSLLAAGGNGATNGSVLRQQSIWGSFGATTTTTIDDGSGDKSCSPNRSVMLGSNITNVTVNSSTTTGSYDNTSTTPMLAGDEASGAVTIGDKNSRGARARVHKRVNAKNSLEMTTASRHKRRWISAPQLSLSLFAAH